MHSQELCEILGDNLVNSIGAVFMVAAFDGPLDAASAQARRRAIYAKPFVSRADFEDLLEIGRGAGSEAPREYDELLADVATDLLVNQVDPAKYVARDDADWFVAQIKSKSGLSCRSEYQALLAVMRFAVSIPPSLAAFTVGEIEKAILEGHQAGGRSDHSIGVVSKDDVEALRLAVFAPVEGSSLHVTRDSAEALFRIAHSTAGANNDPGFDDFFAKAVGNYLTGIAFHWTPSAADERATERWLDDKPPSFAHSFGALAHLRESDEQRAYAAEATRTAAENAADLAEIASRRNVSAADGDWVLAHLKREGPLAPAETALLRFLKSDARSLPPALAEVIEARAA
jgi:hypothetical protein